MRERKVVLTAEADRDMECVEAYVAEIYRPESGRHYVRRLYSYISELSFAASTSGQNGFVISKYQYEESNFPNRFIRQRDF